MVQKRLNKKDMVLAALKKIGGKGTTDEIIKAIAGFDQWTGKTPERTVSSFLTSFKKEGILKNQKGVWIYNKGKPQVPANKKQVKVVKKGEKGLYLIILSNETCRIVEEGIAFKVGSAENIDERIKRYNEGLPFATVAHIDSFPISSSIDSKTLKRTIEPQIREKLIKDRSLGYHIKKYGKGNQTEWLLIQGMYRSREIGPKLIKLFRKTAKNIIDSLKKGD